MKYYVFGGNGFVGRYLSNALLERKCNVVVCDIQPSLDSRIDSSAEYLCVDIRDKSAVAKTGIGAEDVVINMAATQYHTKVPRNRKDYFFNTNYAGTKNILQVMDEGGASVI